MKRLLIRCTDDCITLQQEGRRTPSDVISHVEIEQHNCCEANAVLQNCSRVFKTHNTPTFGLIRVAASDQ